MPIFFLIGFLFAGQPDAEPVAPPQADAPIPVAFSIRADPVLADDVNRVLRDVAAPTVTALSFGGDARTQLSALCGGRPSPDLLSIRTVKDRFFARHVPCLRIARDQKVAVKDGNTLHSLAIRNGLSASWIDRFRIIRRENTGSPSAGDLQIGDSVVIPQVPLWTDAIARRDRIATWRDLVSAFGRAFNCPEDIEECLVRKGVTLLPRGSYKSDLPSRRPASLFGYRPSNGGPIRIAPPSVAGTVRPLAGRVAERLPEAIAMSVEAAAVSAMTVPDIVSPTAVAESPPLRVASSQWPYDAELFALVLARAATHIRPGLRIGVADGGLASAVGAPLPSDIFDPSAGEETTDTPEPDGQDDDGNRYVDDVLGAGVVRQVSPSNLIKGDGDLRLCTGMAAFGQWESLARQKASHGSVVASLAAGLPLRRHFPQLGAYLPKVVFYRLLPDECSPGSEFEPAPGEINEAFTYLFDKSDIVNLSYKVADEYRTAFQAAARASIEGEGRLLVVSAGNDTGNVFQNRVCPACLAHPDVPANANVAKRTIVVGAASSDLTIAPGSGYGDRVVAIYAPGQPLGAVDIAGGDASAWPSATSYAAPQVAFAAALLRALGVEKYYEIKERLRAATWLLGDRSGKLAEPAGVLDLVRIAAVWEDVVEVTESDNGTAVRQTYVGRILEPIDSLQLCSPGFSRSRFHSMRLSAPAADGTRTVAASPRRTDPETQRYEVEERPCEPGGSLTLRSLRPGEGDLIIPLAKVNHILLAWKN